MISDNIPDNNNYAAEISALKNQVFTLLLALVVVSGTLTVYLYREATNANKDVQQLNAAVTQQEGSINNFVGSLVAYGNKHPDFLPVLKKYGIVPAPGGGSPPAH
jgi:hypothetical protein